MFTAIKRIKDYLEGPTVTRQFILQTDFVILTHGKVIITEYIIARQKMKSKRILSHDRNYHTHLTENVGFDINYPTGLFTTLDAYKKEFIRLNKGNVK